jgi:hypothetical protein
VERSVRPSPWRRKAPPKGRRASAVAIEAGDDLTDLDRIRDDGDDGHAGSAANPLEAELPESLGELILVAGDELREVTCRARSR